MDVPSTPNVVVSMCTFRRPDELDRTLRLVLGQVAALTGAQVEVVIVDNDPEGGAHEQVMRYADRGVRYVHEPRPGIAAARNRALHEAGDADAIVFCDDDGGPHPGWLQALVDSWKQWGCAGVTGPVRWVVPEDAEEWIRSADVFAFAVRPNGTPTPGASTSNLLLDLRVLRSQELRFDDEFGLSGGSDTMLAHTLRDRGEQIRWCQEAVVDEVLPAERTSRQWTFNRNVRTSNAWARIGLRLAASPRQRLARRAEYTARGGYRLARGTSKRAVGRLRGDVIRDCAGAMDQASGMGLVLGAWDIIRYEYRRS